jgi:outer membrane protein assembly factor BamB
MPAPSRARWAWNTRVLAHLFRFAATTLVFLAALSSAALAQPAVTVNPKSGPPTAKTAVSGTGFGADEAVDTYFDTTDLALAATGSGGAFTGIHLTIPASAAPGTHWMTGVGRRTGLAAQTSFIVQTDWREFHEGRTRQGHNSTENTLNVSNVSGMQIRWSANIGVFTSSPAVANGVVYVGSYDYNLHAINALTGQPLWSAPTQFDIDCSPAVAGGVVYVASDDGSLYAFNAATGRRIWRAGTGIEASSPAVVDGVVYVGSSSVSPVVHGVLYAFNAKTGQTIWSAVTGGQIGYSSPAIASGIVYIGSDDTKLYAFNAATGQPLWSAGNLVYSSPAVVDGIVYVGSQDTKLYAFNAATGQLLWSAATGGQIYDSPAVANGVVYVASGVGELYAFNAATGQSLWSGAIAGNTFSSPAVANGVVYVGSGSLYAFGLPPAEPPARPDPATLKPDFAVSPQT